MERSTEQKQQQARNLYLHTDKTQKEIANILDVNSKTLYLWIKHNRWEEIKVAARQAPMCMVQDMYNHIQAINKNIYSREDHCPTPKEVDMLKKLAGTAKQLEAKNLGIYIETFMELISFINVTDRELALKVTPIADRYIKAKISKMQKFTPDDDVRAAKENLKAQELEEKEELENEQKENEKLFQPIEPLNERRAQSGMAPQMPLSTKPNTDDTFGRKEENPIPEKTEKNHHQYGPRFMRKSS